MPRLPSNNLLPAVVCANRTCAGRRDPARAEAAITNKTRAIVAVHTFGHPADMTIAVIPYPPTVGRECWRTICSSLFALE